MSTTRHQTCSTRAASFLAALAVLVAGSLVAITGTVGVTPASAATTSGSSPGYWLFASDGGVYQFGTTNLGSMRGHPLARPVVGGAATLDGRGYWLVASDGGIFAFGDAPYRGSTGLVRLVKPIVGMAAHPPDGGYWLVASDGGVFSFHAPFYGSTGKVRLTKPIVAMVPTPTGHGYWLVASDGGVFRFGDAGFFGSAGNYHLNRPIVGMAATANGRGYWVAARDGGIFAFGNAPFLGSTGMAPGPAPIVAIAATTRGFPFPPGGTGFDLSHFDCARIPTTHRSVAVVQASRGAIDSSTPNPCYKAEAAWAGANVSSYIFMDGLPSPAPPESKTGPAGTCNGNVSCESYNFGWYWADHWVSYARSVGVNPTLWWLDVETDGEWSIGPAFSQSNSRVIVGAVAGLRSNGVLAGIYGTAYQWNLITGSSISFPHIPLWVAGAGNISGAGNTAVQFCAHPVNLYEPFAGGTVVLVQYGYQWTGPPAGSYTGPSSVYDKDYACV